MPSSNAEKLKQVIDDLSKGKITELAEYVCKSANIQDFVNLVDYTDLMTTCAKDLCKAISSNVEVSGPEFTQIHVHANRFSKNPEHTYRFMNRVEKIMNSEEFALEVENKITRIISEKTGHVPAPLQEAVDMDVSSGSSPSVSPAHDLQPLPAPIPPLIIPPPPNFIPLPPGPAPIFSYPQ